MNLQQNVNTYNLEQIVVIIIISSSSSSNLHNKKLQDLYFSSDIMRLIKSRRIRTESHVAHRRENFGGKT